MRNSFDGLCVKPGDFYLPEKQYMPLWPVVACDQYTSQKEIWEQMYIETGDQPSALKLIIPECFLDRSDSMVPGICGEMDRYLMDGILRSAGRGMVLVKRTVSTGERWGLVVTVDLENYSYEPGTRPLIRPTEGTVKERIPPRLKVRKDASLELSHILLLIDDRSDRVLGPLKTNTASLPVLYDQDLTAYGGHITGWAVQDEKQLNAVAEAFAALRQALPENGILIAVGDGNHSLATAKAHWENVKKGLTPAEQAAHPARYAMAEINNIYDDALVFEPIHRVVFDTDEETLMQALRPAGLAETEGEPDVSIVTAQGIRHYRITRPLHTLPVGTVQQLLDRAQLKVDYVHGQDAVLGIVREGHALGILLPAMDKGLLFPSVTADGPLPRKTFSMGNANEKRYYMEARKIK